MRGSFKERLIADGHLSDELVLVIIGDAHEAWVLPGLDATVRVCSVVFLESF